MSTSSPEKQNKYTPKTAWKPGQSGNPNGRPKKGQTLTELMTEYLEDKAVGDAVTRKQIFIQKVFDKAIKEGDLKAIRLIWNYVDGMPKQSIDLDVNDNKEYPGLLELIKYMHPREIRGLLKEIVKRKDRDGLHIFIKEVFDLHVPNVAIVPGHSSPFDFIADHLFDNFSSALVLANRSGGKTMDFAILDALSVFLHEDIEVATVAAIQPQAFRCYEYFKGYMNIPAFAWYVISMTMAQTLTKTGCKMQVLTGTVSGVNSPHPQFVFIDEIDLMDWSILQQAFSMAQGKGEVKSKTVLTSTRKYKAGAMQRMINEASQRGLTFYQWNIWEVVEALPRHDEALMAQIHEVFGDELPEDIHKANGYYQWTDLIQKKLQLDKGTWESEWLCSKPGLEGIVYARSITDDNILSKYWTPQDKRGSVYIAEDFGSSDDHPGVALAVWVPSTFDRMVIFDERYMVGLGTDDVYKTIDEMLIPYGHRLPNVKEGIKGTIAGWVTDPAGATDRKDRQAKGAPIMPSHKDGDLYHLENSIPMVKKLYEMVILMYSARCTRLNDENFSYSWKKLADGTYSDTPQKKFDHGPDAIRYLIILLYYQILNNYLTRLEYKQGKEQPAKARDKKMGYDKDTSITGGLYGKIH